jgi:hypothetical protein
LPVLSASRRISTSRRSLDSSGIRRLMRAGSLMMFLFVWRGRLARRFSFPFV